MPINHTLVKELCLKFLAYIGYNESIEITFSNDSEKFMNPISENQVSFWLDTIPGTDHNHYLTVVLHELNHFLFHGMKSDEGFDQVKEADGGAQDLVLYDIEADLLTYTFLKEELGFSYDDCIATQHTNANIFQRDSFDDVYKFARFLGTITSIHALYHIDVPLLFVPIIYKFEVGREITVIQRKSYVLRINHNFIIDGVFFDASSTLFIDGRHLTVGDYISKVKELSMQFNDLIKKPLPPQSLLPPTATGG